MNVEPIKPLSSVVSYPSRGPWGKSNWRGNTSGYPIRDLVTFLHPNLVCDPAEGSGTTRDVCKDMGVNYVGLDLHSGFNLLRDSLGDAVQSKTGRQSDFVFFHPPYHDMITYSGNMWGTPHADDLSRCANVEDFLFKMENAMFNIYDSLAPNGHYAIMIADHRSKGEYRCYMSDLIQMGIGKLKSVIVKQQHNMVSNRTSYSGNFIPIAHEYIMLWVKDRNILSIGKVAFQNTLRQSRRHYGTWKNILCHAMRNLGGKATLSQVYDWVFSNVEVSRTPNAEAKVRQVLGRHFERMERGVFAADLALAA